MVSRQRHELAGGDSGHARGEAAARVGGRESAAAAAALLGHGWAMGIFILVVYVGNVTSKLESKIMLTRNLVAKRY